MFDMRAYVASLIAVFLALAIGILLGTVIQDKRPMGDQIESQIDNLQSEFSVVREENKALSHEVEQDKAFASKVLPVLTSEKLAGRQVVIVGTGRVSRQLMRSVSDTLEKAGAEVAGMDITRYAVDEELRKGIVGYLPKGEAGAPDGNLGSSSPEVGTDGSTPDAIITSKDLPVMVARAILTPDSPPALSDLGQLGVVRLNGPVVKNPTAVVLLTDPSRDDRIMEEFLIPFAKELVDAKVITVAGESGASQKSLTAAFGAAGVSTVDNVDEIVGQISLIYAVGGEKGSFGKKKGAEDIVPALQ